MLNLLRKPLLGAVLLCSLAHAQEKNLDAEEVIKKYDEYFELNRESLYLHLNKTVFAPTEDLWFAAYAFNTKYHIPNPATTNLNVNIYDPKGKLIETKTFFVGNGKGAGFIKLDTIKYPPGDYLMTASTRYMDNFLEELSFSEKFSILGDPSINTDSLNYDLQVLPEGGHLVEGISNTIGVKLINSSGKGVVFSEAKVVDDKGQVITNFKSNLFGLSKFNLVPVANKAYTVVVTLKNGREIKQKLMLAEKTGVVMTANTLLPENVILSIKTNSTTYKNIEGENLFVAIGHKGEMKMLGLTVSQDLEAILKIPKTALYPGINRITLFDPGMKPIAERLIFNREGLKRKSLTAEYEKRDKDSLVIGLHSADSLGLHSMSISVLPAGTKSYSPDNNLLSAFFIEPYIKGNLENGSYYFSKEKDLRRRDYDLDLLLLTQGWSKYSWNNIFKHPPKEYYPHDQGFDLTGRVGNRNKKKQNQVFVKSPKSQFFKIIELDEKGEFVIEDIYLLENDTISFGLIHDRKGKVSKPGIYFQLSPLKKTGTIPSWSMPREENMNSSIGVQDSIFPLDFLKDRVELSEIIIEAIEEEVDNKDIRHSKMHFNTAYSEDLRMHTYITDYIRSQGFIVKEGFADVAIYNRRKVSIHGYDTPLIFLDGMELYDNSELYMMPTKEVESISINKSGGGYGMRGSGGVIRITRKTNYGSSRVGQTTNISILENGFAANREFYAPKYVSYENSFFEEYGSIAWFPDIRLDERGKAEIKVWNTTQPELKLFVEGITENGGVVSEVLEVRVE